MIRKGKPGRLRFLNSIGGGLLLASVFSSLSVGFGSFLVVSGDSSSVGVSAEVGNVYSLFEKGSLEPFAFTDGGFKGPHGSLLETGTIVYNGLYHQAKANSLVGDAGVRAVFTLGEEPSLFLGGGFLSEVAISLEGGAETSLSFALTPGAATTENFLFPSNSSEEIPFALAFRFRVPYEEAAILAASRGEGSSFGARITLSL